MTWYYRLATLLNPFFLLFIRATSLSKRRVRVIVRNQKGEILLVKAAFGMKKWEFPGGEIGRGETEKAAAIRELREETALIITKNMIKKRASLLRPFSIELFECIEVVTSDAQVVRPWEIRTLQWYRPHELPADTAGYVTSFLMK